MAHNLVDAIYSGDLDLARNILLQGHYAAIDGVPENRPGTALFCCCIRGYLSLASLLLKRQADVDSRTENQATPLHGAVDNGHLDLVRLLLSHNADVNAQTIRGDTPLHLAAYRGFPHISQCLVVAGADISAVNTGDMTPEMEASGQGHSSVAKYLRAVYEVIYPDDDRGGRRRSDSLIYLEPPQTTSAEIADQQLARLEQEQQTRLAELRLPVYEVSQKSASEALAGQFVEIPVGTRQIAQKDEGLNTCPCCAKGPLKERHFNMKRHDQCRGTSDREELQGLSLFSLNTTQNYRQPQQHDENDGPQTGDIQHYGLLQHHQRPLDDIPQQYSSRHNNTPLQHSNINSNPGFHQFQQHQKDQSQQQRVLQAQSNRKQDCQLPAVTVNQNLSSHHPQFPPSLLQPDSTIQPNPSRCLPHTYSYSQSAIQPCNSPINITQNVIVSGTKSQTMPYNINNEYQRMNLLRPEIITCNERLVARQLLLDSPRFDRAIPSVSSAGSSTSGSGRGSSHRFSPSVSSGKLNSADSVASMVLSEDDEDGLFNHGGLYPDSINLSPMSSLHQPRRLCPTNKVLRSKSLNSHHMQWRDFSESINEEETTKTKAMNGVLRRPDSLRNFVPVGPPPLPSESLEVQHPSLYSLGSLRSGLNSYGSATSISEVKQFTSPKRLSRSASSSPSVGIEISASASKSSPPHQERLPGFLEGSAVQTQCKPIALDPKPSSDRDGHTYRRCSVDEEFLKCSAANNLNAPGNCRRFSVAGINSINSASNVDSSSSGSMSIVRRITSIDASNVSSNLSYNESAYGSSETSLVSSASDSYGYVHNINSISDSATDLSCDKETDDHRSRQELPPVSTLVTEAASPETENKMDNMAPSSPLLRPPLITRFHSLPNYCSAENNDTNNSNIILQKNSTSSNNNNNIHNNINKISNHLSKLNNLSVSPSQNLPTSSKSALFETHQSMPPLMTCVNIPIN